MADTSREINMVDVARRAGVSIATVSRALRDVPGVRPATRERVRQVAEELEYVVSPEASRLARRTTGRVAVVVPKIDVWFYSAMLAAIEPMLRDSDLDVLVYQVDGENQRSTFFRELPARRKVDAVVLIALPMSPEEEARLDLLGVHVVVAGGRLRTYPDVRTDDAAAAVLATQHLLDLGHRRITMIRTDDTEGTAWSANLIRTQAFRDALLAQGITSDDAVVTVPAGPLAGAEGMALLLDRVDPPTAVLAYSDEIAMSALALLAERGVPVPSQMSVVGVDGHPLGEAFGLTTVSQLVADQGRRAAQMILDVLVGHPPAPDAVLPCELIVRTSTGPPPA